MKAMIVLPTYNERDNIGAMIDSILTRVQKSTSHQLEVLVVDDNSPDGTQAIVTTKMAEYPTLHLMTGNKKGLGVAYIRGMNMALRLGAEVIFEMDADFSHNPDDIPAMIDKIAQGYQFVIGSRYVRGGSIPSEWHTWRKLNSWGGNLVARLIAGIYTVNDCTSGFRAISAQLLKKIDLDAIPTQGYGFQVSLLHEAYTRKARIFEWPIQFKDRTLGESKLGLRDILEFVLNAFSIRLKGSATLVKFLTVGLSGVAVNLGAFSVLLHLGINKYLASPIAIEISILSNFLFNNVWTFRKRQTKRGVVMKGLYFNIVSILSLAISYTTFALLSLWAPQGSAYLFQIAGIIPAAAVNYFFNSYWTFHEAPKA